MPQTTQPQDLSDQIATHLPYLRRYARALTGSQSSGDKYAMATLEAILEDRTMVSESADIRIGLFRTFHSIWKSSGSPVAEDETGLRARAQKHLARLTENTREALLLNTIEEFSQSEIAQILSLIHI